MCRKAPAPWLFSCPVPTAPHPGPLAHRLKAPSRELLQQCTSFLRSPAQLVYRAKGGGELGDWHARPSMDRPTSAWLAFLPEEAKERVSLSHWAGREGRRVLDAGE